MKSLSVSTPTPPITRSTVESSIASRIRERVTRVGQEIQARYNRGFTAFRDRWQWESDRQSVNLLAALPTDARLLGFLLPVGNGRTIPLFEGSFQFERETLLAVTPAGDLQNLIRVEANLFQLYPKKGKGVAKRFYTNELVSLGGQNFILKLLEPAHQIKTFQRVTE